MKFYRIDYGDWGQRFIHGEQSVEWATNKRDAERIARENNDGDYLSKINEIDVPTDKNRLLVFLNENIWR